MISAATIDTLTDTQAISVLALAVDRQAPLRQANLLRPPRAR